MSAWGSQWQRESQGCPLGMPQGGRCLPAGLGPLAPWGGHLRLFLSSNSRETFSKPLTGDLHSYPGSVPPGTAMRSSKPPGIPLEQHRGSGEPSLGSKRRRSVCGPSVLPSCPWSAFPGPAFSPVLLGQRVSDTLGKGWLLPM